MITLFSTPKDFTGIFKTIQLNALRSWRALSPEIQIVIFGDSKGSKEAAQEVQADYIAKVKCSPQSTPILSDLFNQAQNIANYSIMTFINADIILPKNFLEIIQLASQEFRKFLMMGHRWDMDVEKIINFNVENDIIDFWNSAKETSKQHPCTGIDYFVFKKGQFNNIPNFIIGRWGWDNWLIWKARRKRIPVIDASSIITVIHQNHDYNFHHVKNKKDVETGKEARINIELHQGRLLNILDANYKFCGEKIKKKTDQDEIIRFWHRLPSVFPELALLIKLFRRIRLRSLDIEQNSL